MFIFTVVREHRILQRNSRHFARCAGACSTQGSRIAAPVRSLQIFWGSPVCLGVRDNRVNVWRPQLCSVYLYESVPVNLLYAVFVRTVVWEHWMPQRNSRHLRDVLGHESEGSCIAVPIMPNANILGNPCLSG